MVTRPVEQASSLGLLLEQYGAQPIYRPAIEITGVRGTEHQRAFELLSALPNRSYSGVIFASANAVRFFFEIVSQLPVVQDLLQSLKMFAVGEKTARLLKEKGYQPLVASEAHAKGLVQQVHATFGASLKAHTFLVPRGRQGRADLVEGLQNAGAMIDTLILYDTLPVSQSAPLPEQVDWVIFASPSAIHGFLQHHQLTNDTKVACLGPTTATAAKGRGLRVDVTAKSGDVEDLLRRMDQKT